jgi:hypothetical protein
LLVCKVKKTLDSNAVAEISNEEEEENLLIEVAL